MTPALNAGVIDVFLEQFSRELAAGTHAVLVWDGAGYHTGGELVVMEATGGLEKLPFGLLWEAGLACAIANPRQVRRFAEAMGYLEKTDQIDTGVIAEFGQN